MDLQSILNTDDEDVAVLHVKFKWRTSPDHVLMRVPICRTARQAAGWLRVCLFAFGPFIRTRISKFALFSVDPKEKGEK